jgi:dTDP-4-dehydrorhamnose reductase
MRHLLVIGSSSYLGRHLVPLARGRATRLTLASRAPQPVSGADVVALELDDPVATRSTLARLAPDAVLNLAAVNPGAGDDAAMQRINADAPAHLAHACAELGARFVHVSTDIVHDGRHAPYADDAPATPLNAYGRTKAEGEARALAAHPATAVVRTSLIYGLDAMDRGTASFAARLARGESVALWCDVVRQPVLAVELSEALLRLATTPFGGRLNVVGDEPITRARFGELLLAHWRVDGRERVTARPLPRDDAATPRDLRLDATRASALLDLRFHGVAAALAAYGAREAAR